IDPGALRTELALEEAMLVPDGMGGHAEEWGEIAIVFGMIEPVRASSVFGAGQTLESVSHRITIRYRQGVAGGMRLRRQDRMFDIVTVHDPDETRRYLVCRVNEAGA